MLKPGSLAIVDLRAGHFGSGSRNVYTTRVTSGSGITFTEHECKWFRGNLVDNEPVIVISCPEQSLYTYMVNARFAGWAYHSSLKELR